LPEFMAATGPVTGRQRQDDRLRHDKLRHDDA
jgi:hypothetical protein